MVNSMSEYQNNFYAYQGFIDTHAHLSMLKKEENPVKEQIAQLFESGFQGIIDIGTEADDLNHRLHNFAAFNRVWFSAGIWPSAQSIAERKTRIAILEKYIALAPQNRIIAIGECGLDRYHNKPESGADLAGEQELLELQLDLAKRLNLPIIIHSREAPRETKEILSAYPEVRGVIHCFSYGLKEARDFLNLGYYLSFAGVLTYKTAQELREVLKCSPLDRIVLETDSPFLAPLPFRGKPAHPGMVAETYKLAGALLKIDIEELKNRMIQNSTALFGIAL
jgi:TatD DNase family protein